MMEAPIGNGWRFLLSTPWLGKTAFYENLMRITFVDKSHTQTIYTTFWLKEVQHKTNVILFLRNIFFAIGALNYQTL